MVFILILVDGNAAADTTEQAQADYLILLHGLGRTHRSMKPLQAFFSARGYRVINVDYPGTRKSIAELSRMFAEVIEPMCTRDGARVHVLTHSLGGIILRYYMERHVCRTFGRAVMLSPPNQGSELVDQLHDSALFGMATGPSGKELGTGSESVPRQLGPVEFELGIIAGNKSINPVFSAMIPGEDDGTVAVESTKVKGMRDFIVVPATHTFIMHHTEVMEQAHHFIVSGKFKRSKKRSEQQKDVSTSEP
jgi:hypothetical protein